MCIRDSSKGFTYLLTYLLLYGEALDKTPCSLANNFSIILSLSRLILNSDPWLTRPVDYSVLRLALVHWQRYMVISIPKHYILLVIRHYTSPIFYSVTSTRGPRVHLPASHFISISSNLSFGSRAFRISAPKYGIPYLLTFCAVSNTLFI